MLAKVKIKARRRISDEVSKAIRQDAKAGMTVQELMDKYGIVQSTVQRHMIVSPRDRKALTEFQRRDICKMYKQGATTSQLAGVFNLSVERVRLVVAGRRNGCQTKNVDF